MRVPLERRVCLALVASCLMTLGLSLSARPLRSAFAPLPAYAQETPARPAQTRQDLEPGRAPGAWNPLIPTGITEAAPKGRGGAWQPPEPYEESTLRVVDLVSGLPLGVARVSGPRSKLKLTQSVVRFAISFKDFFSIDIYVPVPSRGPSAALARVQKTGITGLGLSGVDPPHLTLTGPPPARGPASAGIFERFSGQMNSAINGALAQRGAGISVATKVVPVFRSGSGGQAVGAAQVMGPTEQVGRVQAVAEVGLALTGAMRARGLIPVSTRDVETAETVPGVAISAEARLARP